MVDGPKYEVEAELRLDPNGAATRAAVSLQQQLMSLGQRLQGANNAALSMTRNMLALGASYVGIRALTNATSALVHDQLEYTAALASTRIGLTSVLSAVSNGNLSLAQSGRIAGVVFDQLRNDAIKSVGTAQDLFDIYQAIVGPVVAAGKGLTDVRTLTRDSVSAAAALNVDFMQARRDMTLMVRGAAGMDVKLFSMLRSTGAIAETTEQWNKSLTGAQRVEKLEAALAKFRPAADMYAKSWRGVTSTFSDIRHELGRAGVQPILDAATRGLGRVNDALISHQVDLEAAMRRGGERIASVIDRGFEAAVDGVRYVVNHWDELLKRGEHFGRMMIAAAKSFAVYQAAGLAMSGVGGVLGMVGRSPLPGLMSGSVAAAAAASGPAAAAMPEWFQPTSLALAGAGAGAGAGEGAGAAAAGVGLGSVLAVAGAVAALAVGAAAAYAELEPMRAALGGIGDSFGALGGELWTMIKQVGAALLPVLKILGSVIGGTLMLAATALVAVLRPLVAGITFVFEWIEKLTTYLWETAKPYLHDFFQDVKEFFDYFNIGAEQLYGASTKVKAALFNMEEHHPLSKPEKLFNAADEYKFNSVTGAGNLPVDMNVPTGRTTHTYDFRGSKIEVKQSFKEADPDRVLMQMIDGLGRAAEMRLQSGFVPALTR